MARLPKWVADPRQPELFDRRDIPAHTPRVEFYAEREGRREQRARSTPRPILWEGLNGWVRQLASCGPEWQLHGKRGERFARIARTISVAKVRTCRDAETLERAEGWLADPLGTGLGRALPKTQLGELLAEVRNRRTQLALGRIQPREKGPTLDPARIPTEALLRLIQRHRDMALVERMREELRRRG